MLEYIAGVMSTLTVVWFIHGLTRHRDMRADQYRDGGEFDEHIDVKKWNKKD